MNCKLFEADHEDISCDIFDIVASREICDANTVSFLNYIQGSLDDSGSAGPRSVRLPQLDRFSYVDP